MTLNTEKIQAITKVARLP